MNEPIYKAVDYSLNYARLSALMRSLKNGADIEDIISIYEEIDAKILKQHEQNLQSFNFKTKTK